MDLLASVIWVLIIINIFVQLQITNKYFIALLLVIVFIEIWEYLEGYKSSNVRILALQAVVLFGALYYQYRNIISLIFLVLSGLALLISLLTDDYDLLLYSMSIFSILITLLILWYYNNVFCVRFPAILLLAIVTISYLVFFLNS